MVAGAHSESDSATAAGTNRCPQGVSQIRSVGSGNVLHNANTDLFEVDAIVSFKASFGLPVERCTQTVFPRPFPRPHTARALVSRRKNGLVHETIRMSGLNALADDVSIFYPPHSGT